MTMISSMYRMEEDGIIYHDIKDSIKIPYERFEYIRISGKFKILESEVMITLANSKAGSIYRLYHLAAILQKLHPDVAWDWITQFTSYEKQVYRHTVNHHIYFEAHGLTKYPNFQDDFASWQFDLRIDNWFKEKGLYKSDEELNELAAKKVQELIYDRAKTDFIDLSMYWEFMNRQQKRVNV